MISSATMDEFANPAATEVRSPTVTIVNGHQVLHFPQKVGQRID